MSILVQKFGGTSVASYEKMNEVCKIVERYKEKNLDLVLVVSAMGRKGAPYATDTLIDLCSAINDKPSKRENDLIMSCGEIISGTILVNMLKSKGIEAIFLTGQQAGILTSDEFSNARIKYINPKRIQEEVKQGKVVVIAGFQGATEDGEITTLGRGGSDTSAVAIGKALGSETVEIYTDVDGIMTADPRVEPRAKVLDFISYEEVFQMADKGAKVIHPRAVQLAKDGNITLVIKNTLNPTYEGTKIGSSSGYKNIDSEYEGQDDFIAAVANKDKVVQVKIKSEEDIFTEVLNEIENRNISIDMINFFISEKAFVTDEADIEELEEILNKFDLEYKINGKCAKVTLIGSKITGVSGVMAKIVRGLSKAGISLLQTSDSNMTISCLVHEKDMQKAVNAIHGEFYKK
ncbi:aspartate kinase [Asaccharospora irregularis]|uniref:Aspartokinase n=1 Tax=Asaccharospora irregularis DSM 2635 TaxID=1121321 RepID=A0A1M5NLD2_9FIRM|nr:aspartate kinase [Asaccharospora irregularis]SHG90376.1 aspartate kinase [Asaccharospora irregularis DSM 2635]